MNAVVAAACEETERLGGQPHGVRGGFGGLAAGRVAAIDGAEAGPRSHEAGTWLGTSRWPALRTAEGLEACRRSLEAAGLDALVVVGGNGSAMGARALAATLPVAFVPATIDRDIEGTDLTIGMNSAIGLAVDTIDLLRITARSLPGRAFLMQTLGAPHGFLARAVASAAGIDLVLVPERPVELDAVAAELRERAPDGSAIAVMSEAVGDAVRLAEALSERAGIRVHPTILGHAQRAATPSAQDRALARAAGHTAVAALAAGRSCFVSLAADGTATAAPLGDRPAAPAGA
jgi:6-phosphofructokinase 1